MVARALRHKQIMAMNSFETGAAMTQQTTVLSVSYKLFLILQHCLLICASLTSASDSKKLLNKEMC